MFYAGGTRNSYDIQKVFKNKISSLKSELKSINEIALEAKKIILSEKNYSDLGLLMNETWKVKRKLSHLVSNQKIDEIYELAIKSGATGGKLLGAGSTGFLVFYCPKKNQPKLIKKMNKLIHIPFEFETDGAIYIK